jgi:Uma2 family endonuclease
VIAFEPELHLGKNVLVPDIAGWRRARMPEVPDVVGVKLAPDWICEGLSPSTAKLDKGRKRELYAKAGIGHLWFADPDRQEIDVLELRRKAYVIVATATRGRTVVAPFDKAIDLDLIWQR